MRRQTPTYRFNYFTRGSNYSGEKDRRRFLTLDYNLESYIGIVGVGVISGWTVEPTDTPLQIKILPGTGMVNGFFSESQYIYEQRSDMVSGNREVEIVEDDNIPEANLTDAQRAIYVAIRQEYEPSYNPVGPITNSYIKVVTPSLTDGSIMNLDDNEDTYIYAERYYPDPYDDCWNNGFLYPITVGDKPYSGSYKTYSEYKVALDAYNATLVTMRDFRWRQELTNHFTAVKFEKTFNFIKSVDKVLLAKVVTRAGVIKKIDTKDVESLANLTAAIKEKARPYIAGHIHGGNDSFDPSYINLKTDIRRCVLSSYRTVGQSCTFDILENTETSVSEGHNHSYKIDSIGNGYTIEVNGSDKIHFHKISDFIVGNQEYTTSAIQTHIHTIPLSREVIDEDANSTVYINDIPVTSNVDVDLSQRKITINGLVGETYKTYSTSFDVNLSNTDNTTITETYSYEKSSPSVISFMMNMIVDFSNRFGIDQLITETDSGINVDRHPFLFLTQDGGLAGLSDLISQSTIAQTLLKNIGDVYTFTPNAARNITILFKDSNSSSIYDYNVKIEILGNTEVTGVLREESIAFISAEKFTMGIFDIARIPPLNHMGRMGEEFIPYKYPMVSTNGIIYNVSPAITTTSYDHYHKLNLNEHLSGVTKNTYVSEDPVYYAYSNGTSYLIAHNHGVVEGVVNSSEGRDLAEWQTAIYQTNVTSAIHTHSIIESVKGDPKIIYSIAETSNGSILAGTSSGIYIVPSDDVYLFVINNIPIYQIGDNLWNNLIKVKEQYELQTGNELVVTEDLYLERLQYAANTVTSDGDSILILGNLTPTSTSQSQDQIMLQKVTSFPLPNFKYSVEKSLNEVEEDEMVTKINLVFENGTSVTQDDIDSYYIDGGGGQEQLEKDTIELVTVEKNLQSVPIWSISTNINGDTFVCGSTNYSKISNLENNLYTEWSYATKPRYSSVLRKVYEDSQNNVWIPTEKGLLVARNYQNGFALETTTIPDISVNVNDVIEGESGKIYAATSLGVSVSLNYGKTWTSAFNVNQECIKLLKEISSGNLFAITSVKTIYYSADGITWNIIGSMMDDDFNDIIIFEGYFYAGTSNGLYRCINSGGNWERVLEGEIYSINIMINSNGILVGSNQNIYLSLDGTTFSNVAKIDGSAAPTLYTDDGRQVFGYAYGSRKQQIFFKEVTYTEDPISALVDFNLWMAKEGTWNDDALCDIYIDRQLIYSSKRNIDKRQEENYLFDINSNQGTLDFAINTVLTEETKVFDSYISVANSSGFSIGDRIYVVTTDLLPQEPLRPESMENILSYYDDLENYYKEVERIENMFFYSEISAVVSGRIFLTRRIDSIVSKEANVYKIPSLNGSTSIFANIYDSMLSNIGSNTHEELDDKSTYASDNRPYQFNNSYLSNLLQLTQAVKYAYPDIDQYMTNTKFFDFRYSWSQIDPDKPYIGDIIDLYSSEVYNDGLYNSNFTSSKSKMVNKILIGHGMFANIIMVATDIGIFYSKFEESMEYNWFYTFNLRVPTYDILISNSDRLLAATTDGIYESTDLIEWNLISQPAISLPIYTFSYRWSGRETVETPSHSVTFSNVSSNGIISSINPLYALIQPSRVIRVIGSTTGKDGNYGVKSVTPYQIIVNPAFSGTIPSTETIVVKMGSWWEYLNSDISTDNQNINNTILAGGSSMIAFATNVSSTLSANQIIWRQSEIPTDLPKFSTSDLCPLTNGVVLAAINGTLTNEENNILRCTGSGSEWLHFNDFKAVKGTILSKQATSNGHAIIKVNYNFPSNYVSEDYSLNLKEIGFFNGTNLVLKTYVILNEFRNGFNYITVYGQEVIDIINNYPAITFTVYPIKINKIVELNNKNILYGTNQGLYTDDGSVLNFTKETGNIRKVGIGGVVTKIDINGTISSVSKNASTNNIILNIITTDSISNNQLVEMSLYIIDLVNPTQNVIVSNSSVNVNGEATIEISELFSSVWNSYVNKRVTIVGSNSKVYVSFDSPVTTDMFKNGTLYISSDGQNNGNSYSIDSNTDLYLILKEDIEPRSLISTNNDSLFVSQTIKIIDSTNRIKLYVSFDEDAELNQFAGNSFKIEQSSSLSAKNMTVYSNTPFEIVLNPIIESEIDEPSILEFEVGSIFSMYGNKFVPIEDFNNVVLSESINHYHDVSLIGQKLKGTISTITQDSSAYMDLTISDATGFDSEVLISNGTIIDNCKVILYNPINMAYSYETTSVSYIAGVLKLRTYNSNMWDISGYNEFKISPAWQVIISSQYSGISSGIYYRDFVTMIEYLTENVSEGENSIAISSTVDVQAGDKIELFDNSGRTFETYISSIIDLEHIELVDNVDNSFLVINSSGIKVLKDSFTNNHTHRIYNGQVETLVVQDYLNFGYSSSHSHRLSPFITDITDITISGTNVLSVGSSEFVYISYNSGENWNKMVDLNKSLEWNEEISGISRVTVNGSRVIVGTTNGQIFSNTNKGWIDIPLEKPL